jgi:hypothetical protein
LPDIREAFMHYLRDDSAYFDLLELRQVLPEGMYEPTTMVDFVNYGVYQCGEHKYIYDEQKIMLMLRHVGFTSACVADYEDGLDPATPLRQRYSFYVAAMK